MSLKVTQPPKYEARVAIRRHIYILSIKTCKGRDVVKQCVQLMHVIK